MGCGAVTAKDKEDIEENAHTDTQSNLVLDPVVVEKKILEINRKQNIDILEKL